MENPNDAFEEFRRRLHPTLTAMRMLVELIRHDSAICDVHPTVSMASLSLARGAAKRRVSVAWDEEEAAYKVRFVDPPLEFSAPTTVREEAVLRVIREYLERLSTPPAAMKRRTTLP
jgi:hypothetical protein